MPDRKITKGKIMSLRTVNRTVKQIKDVSIEQMVDVERKTGEEFPRAGVVMIAVINDKRHMIGSIDSVESAEAEIAYWSQYDNPGRQMLSYNTASFLSEGSESNDGVGVDF